MKSMITALWERSVSKNKVDKLSSPADSKMIFEKGGPRQRSDGHFYLSSDTSLLLTDERPSDFSLYLGGNWRFEMAIDSKTGECLRVSGFVSKLTAKRAVLELPDAEPMTLICRSEKIEPGKACYSPYPVNSVLYDPRNKILCLGDPEAEGEAIEFADCSVAVLSDRVLKCVYLILNNMTADEDSGNSITNCIVLV